MTGATVHLPESSLPLPPAEPNLCPGHRHKLLPAHFWTHALSLGLNLSQDQPLSLASAQEGTDHPESRVVGRGSSSSAAGRAAGTALHPWEFPKHLQGGTRGDIPPTHQLWGLHSNTCVTLQGWGDPLRWEMMLSPGPDEVQLILGWGSGYKRGRRQHLGLWVWERVRAELSS